VPDGSPLFGSECADPDRPGFVDELELAEHIWEKSSFGV
jgi:hypothetical protein